jgi:hypothetical protein
MRKILRPALAASGVAALVAGALVLPVGATSRAPDDGGHPGHKVQHVLLISVDGLHQSDLAWYVQHHPTSTLASLVDGGIDYSNASTPFPSDSFPGLIGQVTGGDPSSTGIYYDDTWNHAVFPAGTTSCKGPAPGAEVTYFEALDKNLGALDAGQGIVPAPGADPWANILHMTGNPVDVINPAQLPVDAATCKPIYPNQYLRVNTIFEVAHQHGLVTAWSDKHPAYQIVSGPSGRGVDDFFTPEINSSANPAAPTDPNQGDWTTDNLKTQQYDNYKVEAVLNWIDGHRHDGTGHLGTPAIFGMNFQTVSTAQKLPTSRTEGDTSGNATGGYLADGFTPGLVLSKALDFVDRELGRMVAELRKDHLFDSTAIVVSAKHGQSPMNPAALNRIDDGTIIDALNAAWAKNHPGKNLVAFSVDDDGMLVWFDNQWRGDPAAAPFAKAFLEGYDVPGGSVDGKDISSAGLSQIYAGADAARLFGVSPTDSRVPDLVGISQYGVVYTGKKGKIAEHGGDHAEDRDVPIVVSGPGISPHGYVTAPVETTQIAPTILELLGLDPLQLRAVQEEHTAPLQL